MGRYIGPVCRLCRRVEDKLFLKGERCASPKCAWERRGSLPGMRTQRQRRRRRISDRGFQLREKQKARYTYGMMERQFRRIFAEASRLPGVTGEALLQLLERRLDNVVFRLGFALSRRQGRQLVSHGHFLVNDKRASIPSFLVKPGDVISWVGQASKGTPYQAAVERQPVVPSWLALDKEKMEGKVLGLPARTDIDAKLNEKAIVEYYAR